VTVADNTQAEADGGPGGLSRSGFKRILAFLDVPLPSNTRAELRKSLDPNNSKRVQFAEFALFMTAENQSVVSRSASGAGAAIAAAYVPLPLNCPVLPEGFLRRPELESRITLLLVDTAKKAASCVLATGMGYVWYKIEFLKAT
jgi:hypothetical protein